MAYPQGIDFRTTSGYVTDPANHTYDVVPSAFGNPTYPVTTAQGNTVGYEAGGSSCDSRDRNSANDPRLAGIHFTTGTPISYRFDLPATGSYNVRIAMGDASATQDVGVDLYDTSSSLGSLASGSTSGANQFKDATNTEYSAAAWPGSNTAVAKTFATTICRFRLNPGSSGANTAWAHLYVEAAGGGGASYTLTAAQGSYALSGQAAALRSARKITAGQGSYSLTGQTAGLKVGKKFAAAQGSYSLSGQAAVLRVNRKLVAAQGSYALSGQAATLTYGGSAKVLTAAVGNYSINGQAAGLRATRKLAAAQGTYNLTGQAVLLLRGLRLVAAQGGYALSGQSVGLLAARRMSAAAGSYALSGQTVALVYTPPGGPAFRPIGSRIVRSFLRFSI